MFGRKRERERGRRVAQAAFPVLDEIETEDWHSRTSGNQPANEEPGAVKTADRMARILAACENDTSILPLVIEGWAENRSLRFASQGRGDRAVHVKSLQLSLGVTAHRNLFGLTGEGSPSFNAYEAAEGRSRGWRR